MKALILVDLQNDFLPGGALAVAGGNQVIPVANALEASFQLVVATKDWHPANHGSFASSHEGRRPGETVELSGLVQVLWPNHCVQDTWGAEFAPGLNTDHIAKAIMKGADPAVDSYSGFFDNGRLRSTGLDQYLRDNGVTSVYVMGLATDYCVKYTALDAVSLGFDTWVVEDGCRGVNVMPGDSERALDELRRSGVKVVLSSQVT